MKRKGMKRALVLALTLALAGGGAFTSFAEQWKYEEKVETDYDGSTYTDIKYYLVDDAGQRVLNREWEGGILLADGELYIDEVWVQDDKNKLMYWRNTAFTGGDIPGEKVEGLTDDYYYGTLDWKYQMLSQWKNTLKEEKGTYTMDYQLPANWSEQCPSPIMTSTVDFICFDKWGGWGYVNWTDSWSVDENNIIHMTATYY